MRICVCGWYFRPEVYAALAVVNDRHPVTVIANQLTRDAFLMADRIRVISRENVGLEFGAYQHYLETCWLGDDVLFMHDDIAVSDLSVFDRISALDCDQAFLFTDEQNGKNNQNFHGRAIFCSYRFLAEMKSFSCECHQSIDRVDGHHNHYCCETCARAAQYTGWDKEQQFEFVKSKDDRAKRCPNCGKEYAGDYYAMTLRGTGPHTGFWVDPWNRGHHRGKPPVGVRHYNDEIYHFAMFCARAKLPGIDGRTYDSRNVRYFPELITGKRGVL